MQLLDALIHELITALLNYDSILPALRAAVGALVLELIIDLIKVLFYLLDAQLLDALIHELIAALITILFYLLCVQHSKS